MKNLILVSLLAMLFNTGCTDVMGLSSGVGDGPKAGDPSSDTEGVTSPSDCADNSQCLSKNQMLIQVTHGASADKPLCAHWSYVIKSETELKKHQALGIDNTPIYKDRARIIDQYSVDIDSTTGNDRDGVVLRVQENSMLEISGEVKECSQPAVHKFKVTFKVTPDINYKLATITDHDIKVTPFSCPQSNQAGKSLECIR